MQIAMIGTGYVGLVSGICCSDFGHDVICVHKDTGKIDRLNAAEVTIYEPGLDALIARKMETPCMVDLRNIYSEKVAGKAGFERYIGVGR